MNTNNTANTNTNDTVFRTWHGEVARPGHHDSWYEGSPQWAERVDAARAAWDAAGVALVGVHVKYNGNAHPEHLRNFQLRLSCAQALVHQEVAKGHFNQTEASRIRWEEKAKRESEEWFAGWEVY